MSQQEGYQAGAVLAKRLMRLREREREVQLVHVTVMGGLTKTRAFGEAATALPAL